MSNLRQVLKNDIEKAKMEKQEIEQLLDEMYKNAESPSRVVLDIKNFEDLHARFMLQHFGRYIFHFEHGFDLLVNLVFLINYLDKKSWPKHRSLQFLLLKNNLNPLYSAFDRLTKGFYSDATILLRTPYEAFIKILFISYFPNDPYVALVSKSPKGQLQFNLTNFLEHHLKVDWKFVYNIASSFSHSHNYQTLTEANQLSREKQKGVICFELKYDEKMVSIPMNFSLFLLWCFIKTSMLLFVSPKDKKMTQDFYTKLIATEKAFGMMTKTMPNKWSGTFDDIERILKEVKRKEKIV